MKLRKDQRFTAYCIMLEEAENGYIISCLGLCWLFRELFDSYSLYDLEEKLLPEYFKLFYKNRPIRRWGERIELLKQCIEETSDFP
jgi:hypothetical protein